MGIELKIVADDVSSLHEQLAAVLMGSALADTNPPTKTATEVIADEQPRKRAPRKSKEDAEGNASSGTTAIGDQSSGTASTQTEAGPSSQADEPTVVYADVQKAVNQLAATKGRDAVVKVLNDFGIDHATKLAETQWADVVAELTKAKEA